MRSQGSGKVASPPPQNRQHQQAQQASQPRPSFPTPEGRYVLLSERQQNGVAFSAQRSTKLTVAELTSGSESTSYLMYNVAEVLYICQLHVGGKDAIRTVVFHATSTGQADFPTSHSHLQTADGYDLLVGLSSGEVVVGSLQLQLQTSAGNTRLLNSQHYNPEGVIDNSRVTQVRWARQSEGQMFVVSHASGALYLYAKVQSLPETDNSSLVGPAPIKTLKNSPVGNIPVKGGIVHDFSFSPDGTMLAAASRDGVLRIFEFPSGPLITGFKSYYGGLLCVAWSHDGKYVATGGEDDLVAIFGVEEQRVITWGEGHYSWVSALAFDRMMSETASSSSSLPGPQGPRYYRLASVGQDTNVLFWDIDVEPDVEWSAGDVSPSAPASSAPRGRQIAPCVPHREMNFTPPVTQNRWHAEPMSDVVFTENTLVTACQGGHVKCWLRPSAQSLQGPAAHMYIALALQSGESPATKARRHSDGPSPEIHRLNTTQTAEGKVTLPV